MVKRYIVENITITCEEACPFYFCGSPCKLQKHLEKYSEYMDEESSFTML